MPLLHCTACHHEYEGQADRDCDWCGAPGRILDEKTDLERMLSDPGYMDRLRALMRQLDIGRQVADRVCERRGGYPLHWRLKERQERESRN